MADYLGEITMRSGDRLPLLAVVIEDDMGVPVSLAGATSVEFRLRHEDGIWPLHTAPSNPDDTWLVLPGSIVDAAGGVVAYDWAVETTDLIPGPLDLLVVARLPGGVTISAPSDHAARIQVRPSATRLQEVQQPGTFDLDLYRGDTFGFQARLWEDTPGGTPTDLTGATAKAEIRDESGGSFVVVMDCVVALPNVVDVSLTGALSSTLPPEGVWDLQVTWPGAVVRTVLAGAVTVTGDVTDSTAALALRKVS
jgi:hypothetical protein